MVDYKINLGTAFHNLPDVRQVTRMDQQVISQSMNG
jgi:hypothetical protein